jgi:hypothetical protein
MPGSPEAESLIPMGWRQPRPSYFPRPSSHTSLSSLHQEVDVERGEGVRLSHPLYFPRPSFQTSRLLLWENVEPGEK